MSGRTRGGVRFASRAEKNQAGKPAGELRRSVWMITFADLVTLVLALFVMLFSMSSIDSGLVERISSPLRDDSPREISGRGRSDSRLNQLLELLSETQTIKDNEKRIKELLFPDDVLPPDLDKGMIMDNIRVMARDGGVGIIFSEDLLFPPGSAALPAEARRLLGAVSPLLRATPYDVLIAGHSGDSLYQGERQATQLLAQYQLSGARALAVLGLYLHDQVDKRRLSAAGYGPDRPLAEQPGEAQSPGNRRVEVIIKNAGITANYY